VRVALAELDKRVVEVPPGSNRGERIDVYTGYVGKPLTIKGPAWCAAFACWTVGAVAGGFPRIFSCHRLRDWAEDHGFWKGREGGDPPVPGDIFLVDKGDGKGHAGVVIRVSKDGKSWNSVEGNSGNRLRLSVRDDSDPELMGFVHTVPGERTDNYAHGLIDAEPVTKLGTR
jgi:hypothetical protein